MSSIINLVSPSNGGGQWVRSAISLALLASGRGVRVSNIRSGRPKPGIHAQLEDLIGVLVNAGHLSCEPECPGIIGKDTITLVGTSAGPLSDLEIKSRGSTWLMIQALLIPVSVRKGRALVNGNPGHFNSIQGLKSYGYIVGGTCELDVCIEKTGKEFLLKSSSLAPQGTPVRFLGESFFSTDWHPVEVFQKDKHVRETEFGWRISVREKFGVCASAYDNWIMYAIFLGGKLEIPFIMFDKHTDGVTFIDDHVQTMISLFETLLEQTVISGSLTVDPDTSNVTIDVVSGVVQS